MTSLTGARSRRVAIGGLALLAATAAGRHAGAQPAPAAGAGHAFVRDLGPGPAGRALRAVLARPHDVIVAPDTGLTFGRDTTFARTVLVIGGPTRLAATVHGDVVVVGDLFLRPGAVVDGRALAYGGGLYNSTLAVVHGGARAYQDVTFDAATDPATRDVALSYRALETFPVRLLTFPGAYGLRIPTYTRIDGLVLGAGPELAFRGGAVRVEPRLTYRSHLGVVDPDARVLASLGRRTTLDASVERATLTNDAWIRGDLVNAAVTLASGGDARNYFRADRARAVVARRYELASAEIEPFVGALAERSWAVARDSGAVSAPYSVFGRRDRREGMLRPNPDVTGGRIVSAVAGARLRADASGLAALASASLEVPVSAPGGARFAQLTADAELAFPAFQDHRVALLVHGVDTVGDRAPSQRFAYLGGASTLPSIPLLSLGGDRLLWTETRYTIPFARVHLPLVGSPRLTLRHMLGSAGVGRLPALTQNLGVRVGLGPLRVDYTFDPTGRGDRDLSLGVGFR